MTEVVGTLLVKRNKKETAVSQLHLIQCDAQLSTKNTAIKDTAGTTGEPRIRSVC